MSAAEFEPLVHGLLRQAGVRQNDTLVGVGDGAAWVGGLFEDAGAVRVLDVYHATEYLETAMVALGWDEKTRSSERATWARGEVDGAQWIKDFDPGEASRATWGEEARLAWRYLAGHAASGAMAYPNFKGRGWPIGSGQIEGANKAVIGKRLKQAGMHWSREGMGGMACLRARVCSNKLALDFHIQRHRAFLSHRDAPLAPQFLILTRWRTSMLLA